MPDAIITSTESTFGTISGTFLETGATIQGTITGVVAGTLDGSVGVPGPAGSPGATGPQGQQGIQGVPGTPGVGVPAGGTAGQILAKVDGTNYNTQWVNDSGAVVWGNITGTLSNQTDLQTALNAKLDIEDAESSFYPLTGNPSGFITSSALSGYATESWVTAGFYPLASNPAGYLTSASLSAYAPLASPVFTGDARAVTAPLADNDTSIATTAFVQQELASGTAVAKNLEVYVRNQTGATLTAGTIVYINGATGNRPTITKAQANNDANSAQTFGFVKASIANNGFGYVIVRGELENVDTSALTEGVQLYLSPTVAGTWTTTKPSAPQHLVYVGICVRAHPTQGVILVAVQNGYELNELHDVQIVTPTNGQVLKYDSATGLWKNAADSAGVAWGGITGTLSSQTDLQTALDGKYSTSNPAGYITSSALSPYLLSSTAASTYFTIASAASKANLASPAFTGNPTAPTQATSDNSTLLATTAFVKAQGYLTSAPVTSVAGRTGAVTLSTSDISGLGTMATQTAANYSTTAVANGLYYPLSGNPSGFLTSASLSGYATESFVTSQGYITSSALTPYLTSATAASTYQTLSGMSSYLTTSAAASTYYLQTNPSGYLNTADVGGGSAVAGADILDALQESNAPSTDNPYATQGDVYTQVTSMSATLLAKSSNLSDVASVSLARSNLGAAPLASPTFTGTVTIPAGASISGFAPLASPTFTGTPSLPTGTIAVTQAAGNNTTAVATTAFVTTATSGLANNVKAWVNFGGTGTVSIKASANVTSITDNGVGDYTINFTTAISDANYAVVTSDYGRTGFATGLHTAAAAWTGAPTTKTTTAARIAVGYYDGNLYDVNEVHAAILR